jgi:hypothetical protein
MWRWGERERERGQKTEYLSLVGCLKNYLQWLPLGRGNVVLGAREGERRRKPYSFCVSFVIVVFYL